MEEEVWWCGFAGNGLAGISEGPVTQHFSKSFQQTSAVLKKLGQFLWVAPRGSCKISPQCPPYFYFVQYWKSSSALNFRFGPLFWVHTHLKCPNGFTQWDQKISQWVGFYLQRTTLVSPESFRDSEKLTNLKISNLTNMSNLFIPLSENTPLWHAAV